MPATPPIRCGPIRCPARRHGRVPTIQRRHRIVDAADDRVILEVDFPSDVEAGRVAAIALAALLMQDPAFMKEFAAAKSELRSALGNWSIRLA